MRLKQVFDDKCTCACHGIHSKSSSSSSSDDTDRYQRPTMAELHDLIQIRQWKTIQRALRLDTSVAMRIDDSPEEDRWFATAQRAAWHRHVGIPFPEEERCKKALPQKRRPADPDQEESYPVRYWVPRAHNHGPFSIGQRRTLLHSICKLQFCSEEELSVQLDNGGGDELHDWVNAMNTMEMIIDASHNELRPLNDDDYYEELEEGMDSSEINKLFPSFSSTCQKCSCYYQSQYCPPVGLDPVERYHDNNFRPRTNHQAEKILHKSVLTMPDNLGATPLHLLTEEGSSHLDIFRVFIGKCRAFDSSNAKPDEPRVPGPEGDRRRPTLYDLLSAQNGHGCTPLHFLCGNPSRGAVTMGFSTLDDSMDAQVMRLILDQFHSESIVGDQCGNHNNEEIPHMSLVHPLLIQDGDGDLPLHYATNTGAAAAFLSMLTEYPCASRALLVRNAEGRLPMDELILWYKGLVVADREWENRMRRGINDENENEGHSEDDENADYGEDDENEDYSEDDENEDYGEDDNNEDYNEDDENEDYSEDDYNEDYGEDDNNEDYGEDDNNEDYNEDDNNEDYGEDDNNEDYNEDDNNEDYGEDDNNEDYNEDDDSSESSDDVKREEYDTEPKFKWKYDPEGMVEWMIRSMLSTSREKSSAEEVDATNASLSFHFKFHLWDKMCVLIEAGATSIASDAKGTTAFHFSSETRKMEKFQTKTILSSVVLTKYFDFPALALVASIQMTTDTSEALLEEDPCGLLPLHWACGNITHLLSLSEQYPVSTCKETVHWNTQLPCSMIRYLLHLCPESARVPTRDGRLPLHLFLDGGYDERCRKDNQNESKHTYIWDDVKELLIACPDALRTPDVDSHLYPFQAAAAARTSSPQSDGERCVDERGTRGVEGTRLKSLEITYRLIMEDPSLCRFIDSRHRTP